MAADGYEELVTIMGLLSQVGIRGAEAGTEVRNIMGSLTDMTKEGKATMDSLGVSAMDASGNLRPIIEIMWDLNDALAGLGNAERNDIIGNIFNRYDLKSVNELMSVTREEYAALMSEIQNSEGVMAQMAEIKTDNLAGMETKLASLREANKIAWAEMFADMKMGWIELQIWWETAWGKVIDDIIDPGADMQDNQIKISSEMQLLVTGLDELHSLYTDEEFKQMIWGNLDTLTADLPVEVTIDPQIVHNSDGYFFDPADFKAALMAATVQVGEMFGDDGFTVSIPTTFEFDAAKTSSTADKLRAALKEAFGSGTTGTPEDLFGAGYWADDSGFSTQIAAQMTGTLTAGIISALENLDIEGLTDDVKGAQGDRMRQIITDALFSGDIDVDDKTQAKLYEYITKIFSATDLADLEKAGVKPADMVQGLIDTLLSAVSSGKLEDVDTGALSILFGGLLTKGIQGAGVGLSNNDKTAISNSVKTAMEGAINDTIIKVDPKIELDAGVESKAKTTFEPVGGAIAEGVASGITNNKSVVTDAVNALIDAALAAATKKTEKGSPSKLFAREIGRPIAQGVALGITQGFGDVRRDIESSFAQVGAFAAAGIARSMAQMVDNTPAKLTQQSSYAGAGKTRDLVISIDGHEFARAVVDDVFGEADRKAIIDRSVIKKR